MRSVRAAIMIALAFLAVSFAAFGETPGLSITNYQFVSEQRVTLTQSNVTYRADLVNPGGALASATATMTSLNPFSFRTVTGQDTLRFGPLPAGGQVTSTNTFTILVDRTVPFNWANVQWTFQPVSAAPVANAGPDQTVVVGSTVTLDGSASTNPSGVGTLAYSWAFKSRPGGTKSILMNAGTVMPNFVADVQGTWVVTLTVSNGTASSSADVTISTSCVPPVANPGPSQMVTAGTTVMLDGSKSTDACGAPLTYAWTLTSIPTGSTAKLTGANSVSPSFIADKPNGTYVVTLVVQNNLGLSSTPVSVNINTQTVAPVANAGPAQVVNVQTLVQLDGSKSTDANGLPLTYKWTFNSLPQGSAAVLSNATSVNPSFTADTPGLYVVQLVVNNGVYSSSPSTVNITTNPPLAPTANAGNSQTVNAGTTVQLNCVGTDPQNLPLTYKWALTTKPQGSSASLSSTVTANPVFVADIAGTYVGQCTVNNGFKDSQPSTVTISTTCTPPVADAGADQNSVVVGSLVTLDGSKSHDACNDPLTYKWSLTTVPSGSAAVLANANTVKPTFATDLAGIYVAQLIVNNGLVDSVPATVKITTAALSTVSLTPPSQNIGLNATGLLTVTLASAAPAGGLVVNLASGNTTIATVPSTVTIPAGSNTATVVVTPVALGTATITASATGLTPATATVNVVSLTTTLTLDSTNIGVSLTVNGKVTLSAPAPQAGVAVLVAPNPTGIVDVQPQIVNIAGGATTGAFTVKGLAEGQTRITGVSPGYTTGSVLVTVNSLGSIVLPTTTTVGANQTVSLQVTLSQAAPKGGATITLTSGDTSKATVSGSVFIAEGAITPAQPAQVTGVSYGTATITASAPGYNNATGQVKVTASLSFNPGTQTFPVNTTQNFTLNLAPGSAPAGGLVVTLSSDNTSVATVPSTVTIPANATTITFAATGVAQGSATIHASALPNIAETTALAFVTFFGNVVLPANQTVALGQSANFPVTLSAPAPAGGTTVTLASNDGSKVSISPSTISVPGGQTAPTVQPQISGAGVGSATITATAPGFTQASQIVRTIATAVFSPATVSLKTFETQNLTLTLSANTPVPLVLNLSSDDSAVASVPATATIPANANSVTVAITGKGKGTTTIHAGLSPNVADTTASVTVQNIGAISLASDPSVGLGQSIPLNVTLAAAAPAGGLTVALSVSDASKLTLSAATVTIPAGQTVPSPQPTITGANIGSASITASAPGYDNGSQSVSVTASISFSPTSLSITGTQTQNLTLTLSGNAPAGGLTVNLSSSNTAAATVPATVVFPAGSKTVPVPVTGVAQGSAVIHASNTPAIADTTANVTVTPGVINVPASPITLQLGTSAIFSISLGSPAPTGGVVVTLNSTDSSKVNISSSTVTIPAGQTTPDQQPRINGSNFGTVTINATAPGYTSASQTAQVVASISFAPSTLTINGATTQNLTINLSGTAPTGGLALAVSSSTPGVVTVPTVVTIPAGLSSVTVPVTGVAVGTTAIHANALPNIADVTAAVTVQSDITFTPASAAMGVGETLGGVASPIYINLTSPNTGGVVVQLAVSDSSKISITPQNIFIPAGQQQSTLLKVTGLALGSSTITGGAFGLMSGTMQVQVMPGATLSFSPKTFPVTLNNTQNITLTLSAAQPSALTVNLSSDNKGIAMVPLTATFPANVATITVPVTGVGAGSTTIHASVLPGIPDTTATVNVSSNSVSVANATIGLGGSTTLAVTLSTAAPSGGLAITFASSAPAVVPAPAGITIPAGGTSGSVTVNGIATGSANITAAGSGYASGSGTVTVNATLTLADVALMVGTTQNTTLTLSGPAPAGGLTVNLSSTGAASVPASVSIPASQSSVPVPVTGLAAGSATITATAAAANIPAATGKVTIATLPSLIVPSTLPVQLGNTGTFSVSVLNAPAADLPVSLSVSGANVSISPTTVTIPSGQTSSAPVQVKGQAIGSANITAAATGYTPGVVAASVPAPTLSFSGPVTVNAGAQGTLTLNLINGKAPDAGLTVNLTSDNVAVPVPATASFAAGSSTTTFSFTAGLVTTQQVANIVAKASGIADAATTATVNPAGGIQVSSPTVGTNQSVAITITLPQAATQNTTVTLSSDKTGIATVSGNVQIAAGSSSGQAQVTGVSGGTATISATAPGYSNGSGTVTVTPLVLNAADPTIKIGAQGTVTLTLTGGVAPQAGLQVTLSSDHPEIATVQSPVSFAAGGTSITATVTGVSAGTAKISASTSNPNLTAQTTATVQSLPPITVAPVTVGLGLTANLQVSVQEAPASNLVILLTSADDKKVSVSPASVTIPAGQKQPSTTPVVTGLGSGTINITAADQASPATYAAGTGAVTVSPVTAALTPSSSTLDPGGQATLTLTLTGGKAPTGGLTVNLNSNNTNLATVASPSVTFNAGDTQASVVVNVPANATGGTATITASNANFTADATATVTVSGTISIAPVAVDLGGTATLTVNVTPATVAPLTVNLVSNDTSKATVSPASITIAAGSTSGTATVTGVSPFTPATTVTGSVSGSAYKPGSGTVTVNATMSLSIAPTIPLNGSQVLTITLSGNAPAGGLPVNLGSTDPTIATPASATVTIPAGQKTATVAINGLKAGGPVTITANAPNTTIANATAQVSVVAQTITIAPVAVNLGGTATLNISVSPAPSSPLTVNLVSNDTSKVTVNPASITIAAGSTSGTATVTGVSPAIPATSVTGSVTGGSYSSGSGTVTVNATMGVAVVSPIPLNGSQILTITLSGNAPAGGLPVNLGSTDPTIATPASATVTIPAGQKTATVAINGLKAGGPVTITANAPNTTIANATAQVSVVAQTITIAPVAVNLGGTATLNVSVSPAPSSPLTVNLVSNDTSKVTVNPASITIAAGSTSGTATVTGVSPATPATTVTGSVTGGSYTSGSGTVTVNATLTLSLASTVNVAASTPLTITLSGNAPAGGLLVNLASGDSTTASLAQSSVTISAGAKTATVNVTGVKAGGPVTLTASAPNTTIANATASITVQQGPPPSVIVVPNVTVGQGQSVPLNVTVTTAPSQNLTINLVSSSANATVTPSTITIPAGQLVPSTPPTVYGVSALVGTPITITGSAGGYTAGTGTVVVSLLVGKSLQMDATLTLPVTAPSGGLTVNVTSSDSTKVLVATSPTRVGLAQNTFFMSGGSNVLSGVYLQGVGNGTVGTVTISISTTGYSGQASVTLTPSGFVIAGPTGVPASNASFDTNVGVTSTLTVIAGRLDSNGNYAESQQVSAAAGTISVGVTSDAPAIGAVVTSPVTFTAPFNSATTTFTGIGVGNANVTAVTPDGFTKPASGYDVVTAKVGPPGMAFVPASFTVGKNLEVPGQIQLKGTITSPLTITISSDNPNVKISSAANTAGISAGATTQVLCPFGKCQSISTVFYVQASAETGTANLTASAPGFTQTVALVTMSKSGFIIGSPAGLGSDFYQLSTSPTTITVFPTRLDASLTPIETQALAGGLTATVAVSSSDPGAGTIASSPLTFATAADGSSSANFSFVPATTPTSAQTTLSVNTPSGYSTPTSLTSLKANVVATCGVTQDVVGNKLQMQGTVTLSGPAPAGGTTVTLTSSNAQLLLLAVNPVSASDWKSSIQVTVPAGLTQAPYYIQGLASSGTVTYTASCRNSAASMTLAPSGVVVAGSSGSPGPAILGGQLETLSKGPVNFTVYTAVLNPADNSYVGLQPLAVGQPSIQVGLTSGDTSKATIQTPTTISGGTGFGTALFTPITLTGLAPVTISVTQPQNFTATTSAGYAQLPIYIF
jgi:trimeric autotransporter adhesin